MVFPRKGEKAHRKTSGCPKGLNFAPLRLCGGMFVFILLASASAFSKTPDLTNIENEVREQITSLQNALSNALKDPKISSTELSEAYGKLGQAYHAYSLTAPAHDCYVNA